MCNVTFNDCQQMVDVEAYIFTGFWGCFSPWLSFHTLIHWGAQCTLKWRIKAYIVWSMKQIRFRHTFLFWEFQVLKCIVWIVANKKLHCGRYFVFICMTLCLFIIGNKFRFVFSVLVKALKHYLEFSSLTNQPTQLPLQLIFIKIKNLWTPNEWQKYRGIRPIGFVENVKFCFLKSIKSI